MKLNIDLKNARNILIVVENAFIEWNFCRREPEAKFSSKLLKGTILTCMPIQAATVAYM